MKVTLPALPRTLAVLAVLALPGVALATGQPTIPEPGVLELLVAAGVAGVVVAVRKRRKK